MKKILFNSLFIISLGIFFFAHDLLAEKARDQAMAEALAEPKVETKPEGLLQGIEFLIGFSRAKLHAQGDYHTYPIMVDFNFDLKPLTQKIGINPPMLFQFQIEPFIAPVSKPNANVEIGTAFMFKLGLVPDTWKLQPYLKAGLGLVYMTQHTREQATQFNFIEPGGVGAHYFFNKNTAFTLECRIRHLSNSGIDHPNHGINNYAAFLGISYQFE